LRTRGIDSNASEADIGLEVLVKTLFVVGLMLIVPGLNCFAQTNAVPPKDVAPMRHLPPAKETPVPNPAPKKDWAPGGRDLYHQAQVSEVDLAAFSRRMREAEQSANAAKMERNSWANKESIFRSDNDQAGDNSSLVRDTVVTIFPPGR
jgi:hypothetical protein